MTYEEKEVTVRIIGGAGNLQKLNHMKLKNMTLMK